MSEKKEGTWRVTQGNGREYLVHTENKARVASNCGYTVERIGDDRGLAPTFGIPLHEDMLRSLEHIECVYRTNVVKDDEPSSALANLQRVIARARSETGPVQRIAELEKERDHWKANHDAQVERARVLVERTDMPVERTLAYQHMRTLQRLVEVQKMLLEAFTGTVVTPEGEDPSDDRAPHGLDNSVKRLRAAMDLQQPSPVPDQMALAWRIDLIRLWMDWTHKRSYFESVVPVQQKIRAAIEGYHFALDSRAHGGVAQDRAFNAICEALGMHWEQGKEFQRRAKAASGELTEQISEGNEQ
jgi:hypothetical protein